MVIKMARKNISGKQVEKEIMQLHRAEERMMRRWNPEIAMVTVVAILLILGVAVVSTLAINNLKSEIVDLRQQVSGVGEIVKGAAEAPGVCKVPTTLNP
jgi:hypothetical protein